MSGFGDLIPIFDFDGHRRPHVEFLPGHVCNCVNDPESEAGVMHSESSFPADMLISYWSRELHRELVHGIASSFRFQPMLELPETGFRNLFRSGKFRVALRALHI